MKHTIFILSALIATLSLISQETKKAPCSTSGRTYTKPQFAPAFGTNENDIQVFFDTAFASVKKAKCRISLTLLIDSVGKPSVSAVIIDTPTEIDEKTIASKIATMPNWTPGKVNECDVVVALPILLDVTKKGIKVNYRKVQYN